ncbi:uncharacterized protein LOC126821529 [Patella vulgata]|uniref:uncharacterized protein LOC126821529 n=1 Tax=Patella vulgata TaxID=6465 RepID=UPI00217FD405|nr:uncharacterized protein LOC126821529 [Patella vulgata]
MSNVYERIVTLLSKPVEAREDDFRIQPLVTWFEKRFQLLSTIGAESVKDIIKNCRFERKKVDDIICKQGEVGDCCYLILDGQLAIYILNKDKDVDDENNEVEVQFVYKEGGKLDRSKLGLCAVRLGGGVPVGEVAMEREGLLRTASIIADVPTDLVIIDRALYNRSIRDVIFQERKKKSDFIKMNSVFRSWAPKYRVQLSMALYTQTFSYDSVLVRQGDPVDILYFIISGQVEIQMDPSLHPSQYKKLFMEANDNEAERLIQKVGKVRPPTEVQYSSHIKRRDNPKTMKLCYLGINESVGDVEILMELDTYMQTAVCKEKTEVLVLELKHYERLFSKKHPKTIDRMTNQLAVKLKTRISLLKNKEEIPLLTYLYDKLKSRNRPPPVREVEREFKDITVAEAEREFLNHKGPLIDIFGPGSVFRLIRIRKEKTRNELRSKQMKDLERIQGHGAIPPTLLLTSQYQSGSASESNYGQRPASAAKSSRSVQLATPNFMDNASYRNFVNPMDYDEDYDRKNSPEALEYYERKAEHDEALIGLEERIREWLAYDNPKGGPQVAPLKRLDLEHLQLQVKRGSSVHVKRKKPLTNSLNEGGYITPKPDKLDHLKVLIAPR